MAGLGLAGSTMDESSRRQSREGAAMASDPRPRAQRSSPTAVAAAKNSRREPGRASQASPHGLVPSAGDRRAVRPDGHDERCEVCDSPKCLAFVRADEPPADWKDLVDRWAMLICSGHWSWCKTANVIVTLSCLVLLLSACVGNKVPVVVEFLSASPLRWGSCAGCCALGAAVDIWRVRRGRTDRWSEGTSQSGRPPLRRRGALNIACNRAAPRGDNG